MPIIWDQRPTGVRHGTNPDSLTVPFILKGETSPTIAKAMALGNSPVMWGNLYRASISMDDIGAGCWNVDVNYGPPEKKQPEEGDFKWSFDTTGATKHITQALQHIASYVPSGGTIEPHHGAIGFVKNEKPEGVDVPDRAFKWTETRQLLLADYGFTYSTVLGEYTGRMNNATFRGFPAYTVRFDGASGGQSSKDPLLLEVTYHFVVSPSESNVAVDTITVTDKAGWDIASVCYEPNEETSPKSITQKPYQVDVDRVLKTFDFANLGIGT